MSSSELTEASCSIQCSILAKYNISLQGCKKGTEKERCIQRNVNLDVSKRLKCPKSIVTHIKFNI